jgi:hypothetical protein
VPPSEINETDDTKREDRIGWSLRRLSEMTGFAAQLPIAGNDRDLCSRHDSILQRRSLIGTGRGSSFLVTPGGIQITLSSKPTQSHTIRLVAFGQQPSRISCRFHTARIADD